MKGVLYCQKLEGADLRNYLESEQKINQNLALMTTGLRNLQAPATYRCSTRNLRPASLPKDPDLTDPFDPDQYDPLGADKGSARPPGTPEGDTEP